MLLYLLLTLSAWASLWHHFNFFMVDINRHFAGIIYFFQDPNEDTEWNDILRKKGILPPKEEPKDNEEEELALQQQSVGECFKE